MGLFSRLFGRRADAPAQAPSVAISAAQDQEPAQAASSSIKEYERPAGKPLTFAVDDVEPTLKPLAIDEKSPLARLGDGVVAWSMRPTPVRSAPAHGLVSAMSIAFREHRPFTLTPDAVWLTIAQGVAQHINLHAERLRQSLVAHQGRKTLSIDVVKLDDVSAWQAAIDAFADALGAEVRSQLPRLLTCDFSTTSAVERTASRVVLMESLKRYFDYEIRCVCGIPRITLDGTVEDWTEVGRRIAALKDYDLGWWSEHLLPLADKWIETASGRVDRVFWQSMYISMSGYGGIEAIEGWVQRLFPYFGDQRNDFRKWTPQHRWPGSNGALPADSTWLHPGKSLESFGEGLVQVPVRKTGVGGEKLYKLMAGFAAIGEVDDSVQPCIGWGVCEDPLENLLAQLDERTSISTKKLPTASDKERIFVEHLPVVLRAFIDRSNQKAVSLGELTFLSPKSMRSVQLGEQPVPRGVCFAVLEDGSSLLVVNGAMLKDPFIVHWPAGKVRDLDKAPIIADSTLEFFQRLAGDRQRLYFTAPEFSPKGTLKSRKNL